MEGSYETGEDREVRPTDNNERMKGMELDNQIAKQTYIRMMAETLDKKTDLLIRLMELTNQQEGLIASDQFDEEEFNRIISAKEEELQKLSKLDDGFEKLYESIKEELVVGKNKYEEEIAKMKESISKITDISMKLQATEKRNKAGLEFLFARKRKDIKNARMSSQTVASYYKAMSRQNETQSIFYDKKN